MRRDWARIEKCIKKVLRKSIAKNYSAAAVDDSIVELRNAFHPIKRKRAVKAFDCYRGSLFKNV